jgi:hypothetical protein
VIPGLTMQTSTTTTSGGGCDSGTETVNNVYDSQRRLVSSTTGGVVTTYTAWDSVGRPTAGSYPGTTIANTYNDLTRTWVKTQTGGGHGQRDLDDNRDVRRQRGADFGRGHLWSGHRNDHVQHDCDRAGVQVGNAFQTDPLPRAGGKHARPIVGSQPRSRRHALFAQLGKRGQAT